MNAKRQTIWLVSMLSLMVVLSAYYLFTEDVSKLDLAATDAAVNPQEIKIDLSQTEQAAGVQPGAADAGAKTEGTAQGKAEANAPVAQAAQDGAAKADEQVLQQVEAQMTSASDYFTNAEMKRHEELRKKSDELLTTITDPKQKPEVVAEANNELLKLSDEQEKIDNLEEVLLKDFPQAIVTQEGKKWKVTVQTEKLEKSQGVTIVDLVMKELGATPENIKIQYVRP